MPDQFEQYYKYLKANGADVAPDFNSFKSTLSDYNNASKYYSYLKENQFDVPDTYDSFANTFGLKKKAGNLPSSGIPSRLPNEPNFLQQGQKVASGEVFKDISASIPKTTLKEAVIKDKNNNNSYLGAMWNNVVASAERLAGGAARLAQKFDTSPVSMIQESVDKAASSVTGINYEAQREKEIADKVKSFIGKARTSSSSREYEQGLAEGFDITNGIGLDDLKGLGAVLPSMLADIAIAAPTAGSSFAIQGYDDALSTLDNIPEAKNMSETTRTAFGFGGAIISGVLEKLGMDNILKSGTVTKYVTAKILKEAAGELAKKGVKVTAEQFEKAIANKATQMLTKTALKNTVKAGAKSALVEGATEATQEGAMDLIKLAANQIENKKIFDEEELKNTAASRYLNAAAMGGIFGGGLGSISSRTKNVQRHIENEVKNAKTQEDIDNLVNEINQNVQDGVISENDAQVFKSIVDENINKPISLEIENEKETKLADIDEYINSLDKRDRLYNDKLNELNKERNETISYYDNLSKQSQKNEETSFDDGKVTPTEEIVTEEVTPTEVKVTEEVKPTEEISVYHGGGIKDLATTEGGLFVSADKGQAESYAKGNKGKVQEFKLNKNDISNENNVREVINELGLKSKEEGWDLNDLMLHEIIDPRFETSLSEGDLNKLYKELDGRGYKAIEMLATDVSGRQKNVNDILILNPKETLKEVKPSEEVKEKVKLSEKEIQKNENSITKDYYKTFPIGKTGKIKDGSIIVNTDIKNGNSVFRIEFKKQGKVTASPQTVSEIKKWAESKGLEFTGTTKEELRETIDFKLPFGKKEAAPVEEKITITEKPKEEKTFAQKDLDRAEAKRIHSRVSEMEPPSDAEQVALRYLAEGGKVSQDAINEVSGTTKRASLNTGRRELKTAEVKARDYAGGTESLDDLAHRLWEASGQEISERDIKDALMSEIGNNNTRLDASKAYLERYNIEYQEEQYYERFIEEEAELHAKVQEELERDLRKPLEEETEGMSSEEHINNLINQYEAETKRENKQLRSEGKGEAAEEISGRDTRKKAPEKEELAKEYKEAVSKVSKKAKENAKKEFVERNFDSIVEKLKIQIKCPT
jgi:ribosomal protein S20